METKDIISLICKIRYKANRFIINEMDRYGMKGFATSHGDILCQLLKNEKLTMKELSEKVGKDKSTITALVNKLVDQGYVEKVRDEQDSRIVFVMLTEKGRGIGPVFNKISDELIKTVYKDIPDQEREELVKTLLKIKNNF